MERGKTEGMTIIPGVRITLAAKPSSDEFPDKA